MKNTLKNMVLTALMLSMFFGSTLIVLAQDGDDSGPVMVELAFMKSKNGEYEDVETKMWKPVHAERIAQGKLTAWYLYRVRYPQGTEAPYDYVAVNVYADGAKQLKSPMEGLADMVSKAHPDVKLDDFWSKTAASRDMKWMGLWMNLDVAKPGTGEPPAEIIQVNFFTVKEGDMGAYEAMEREVYKPVHQAAIEAGAFKNWSLWSKLQPRGEDHGTTHITVDVQGTWDEMVADKDVNMGELFKKVHPEKNQEEVWEKMSKLRTTARSEMWELIDFVEGE